MQILGSLCLDEKAMWFTNVVDTNLEDLYGEVANEAQALLGSEVWTSKKVLTTSNRPRQRCVSGRRRASPLSTRLHRVRPGC